MAVQSNDNELKELLQKVGKGILQLPEFQRSWVWDDSKICKLLESITMGFPMGAVMFLETGGEVNYKPRLFTGVELDTTVSPDFLVLDGQQRLTTLYQVFMCKKPVETCFEKNRKTTIYRYYYLDILKALEEDGDMEDAIISISDKKIKTEEIGKIITLDLRTKEDEFKSMMIPLNIIMNDDCHDWLDDMVDYYGNDVYYREIKRKIRRTIIEPLANYKLPVIKVLKSTSQASVCQIFENVNRGGVPLNVFELVTASLAAEGVELRQEWNAIKKSFQQPHFEVINDVEGTDFITSMTLWESYEQSLQNDSGVKCKKKDVMGLRRAVFENKKDGLKEAFLDTARFLIHQGVYTSSNLPYTSQLIPLAAIYAYDNSHNQLLSNQSNLSKLAKWYWCGVFGELYGSANETRYASDIKDLFDWLYDDTKIPDTVTRCNFQATRLLSLQTRNSAAYKGMMALVLQDEPLDFASANKMSIATYTIDSIDIHHIFPADYCEGKYPREKWNSIINKTMISASTNRSIGGVAPSQYVNKLFRRHHNTESVKQAIETHKIDFDLLYSDNFSSFFIDRAKRLLNRIEAATGKTVTGRDSKETIDAFGAELTRSFFEYGNNSSSLY